jgi:hypothetical protein
MKKLVLTKGFLFLVLMLLTNNFLNAQTLLDEKFDGTAMPAGWTFQSTTTDPNGTWTFYDAYDDLEVATAAGIAPQNEWVISPSYDLSSFSNIYLTVSPWMYIRNIADFSNNTFDYKVLVSMDNGLNWIEILSDNALTTNDFTDTTNGSFFYDKTISASLQGFCGSGMNNIKIGFQFTSTGASISTYIGAYLMDVKLSTETPVTTIRNTNLTEISWFSINNFPGTFEIEYGPVGFTQGTGTLVSGLSGSSSSYTLPSSFCNYDCYLRTNLNGTNSVWNKKSFYSGTGSLPNSNTTSNSSQINWTGTFSNYDIEYGLDGFTQGTGTLISNIPGFSYILNGLTPNTTYKYYIRTNCGVRFGAWRNSTFTTTILSVNNITNEEFKIYPNPTNSVLNIKTQGIVLGVKIIDLAGRTTNITNLNSKTIDVSSLSNGMYFVEIKTENGLLKEKFIKE